MGELVVYPMLKLVLGKLKSLADDRITSISLEGFPDQLFAALQPYTAILEANEKSVVIKTLEDTFLLWMQHLETVLHDVDDVVDDVQIHLASERGRISNKVSFPFLRLNPFPQHPKLVQELRGILERLQRIRDEFFHPNPFIRLENLARKQYAPPDFKISAFHGRESDENAVIDLILNSGSEAERVSVVPIVGFKGIGKTTLAQSIYNNQRIQCVFDLTLYLYLAADCPDILSFQKMLIHQISEMIYLDDFRDAEETVMKMKMKLCELLRKYRFFLVLDDFEDTNLHKSIARDLIDMGSAGSAIIVTTSSRRAASLIGTTPAYQLQPLSLDASFQVFAENARIHKQMHPKYETIVREIAELCGGIPLVLKMVAVHSSQDGILDRGRALGFLQDHALKHIIHELRFHSVMLPHLKLLLQSFRLLKACGLSVEALICVWMALGFLHSDDPTQPPEDIGRMYLKDFVKSALFPDVEYAPGGVVRDIKFNEVPYRFATPNARQYWVMLNDEIIFDSDARYIIWDVDYLQGRDGVALLNQNIRHPNKVRLFMIRTRGQVSEAFVDYIVYQLDRLRVLGLAGCDLDMIPQNIGLSTHLRYLDVGSNARIKRLPDSICNLWHLQTLLLHGCHQLEEVPASIGRLQNLRCLTLTILKESLPEEIGQLISLRSLGLASCQRLASLPRSIKNLQNLQTFGIFDCHELGLADSSSVEGLKGLYAIQTLLLSDLAKFASLPSDSGSLSITLKHLLIQSCRSLKETAWITRFRSLRSLTIEDCPDLSALTLIDGTSQFDNLVELVIRSCPSLGYTAWIRQFMSLQSLIIDDCPKLVDLDAGFSDLKNHERLEIRRCPHLTEWFASPAGKDWCHIAHVPVIELDGVRLKS